MTETTHYSYRVFWSEASEMYVGQWDQMPSITGIDATPEGALTKAIRLSKTWNLANPEKEAKNA